MTKEETKDVKPASESEIDAVFGSLEKPDISVEKPKTEIENEIDKIYGPL